MYFIQFLFPDARKQRVEIEMPADIEQMAGELFAAGWSFEIECHPETQIVHMDCCDEDRAISQKLARNGPPVVQAVDTLVREAHAFWLRENKPTAVGTRAVLPGEPHAPYRAEC